MRPAILLFDRGRVATVSSTRPDVSTDTRVIDAAGKHIYPGLIAANTVLGLVEIMTVRGSVDLAEVGPFNPNTRAEVAVNPDSELLPVTRANGILTGLVVPQAGRGGLISGQSGLIELDGWTWEDMTVKAPVGLHIFWPRTQPSPYAPATDPTGAQEGSGGKRQAFERHSGPGLRLRQSSRRRSGQTQRYAAGCP